LFIVFLKAPGKRRSLSGVAIGTASRQPDKIEKTMKTQNVNRAIVSVTGL